MNQSGKGVTVSMAGTALSRVTVAESLYTQTVV